MGDKAAIIDIIGSHSGMHYYDLAFRHALEAHGLTVEIISNYSDKRNEVQRELPNFYRRSKAFSGIYFFVAMMDIVRIIRRSKASQFIYYSFGNIVADCVMLLLSHRYGRIIFDVHEILPLDHFNPKIARRIVSFYKRFAPVVIVHSKKNEQIFCSFGFNNRVIFFEHLRYDMEKEYRDEDISCDLKGLFRDGRICLLFFGHIRASKGIDILLDAAFRLPNRYSIIIAGNDSDGLLKQFRLPENTVVINRIVNDNDLRFLFTNCDFVVLPYREVSQSGVLEMALHFGKIVIASDLELFRTVLTENPSIGYIYGQTSDDLVRFLLRYKGYNKEKLKAVGLDSSANEDQVNVDELVSYIKSH